MTIEKLSPTGAIDRYQQVQKPKEVKGVVQGDGIKLSSEALQTSAMHQVLQIVKEASDIREDRVAEVKAKLDDPDYMNDALLDKLAERLMEEL